MMKMSDKTVLLELRSLAKDFSLLYVEDNESMLKSSVQFFQNFFKEVIFAKDGEEGLQKFKTHKIDLVITDIQMPRLNGLEMLAEIKVLNPEIHVIITSAYDERQKLHQAISLGVHEFLLKPIKIDELSHAILSVLHKLRFKKNEDILNSQLGHIFNYQHNLVMLFKNDTLELVNKKFLDFFSVGSLALFKDKYTCIGSQFQEHAGFLFDTDPRHWFVKARQNLGKLFHVKLRDSEGKTHHLIFKMHDIPEKKDYYILSMDDITELDLLRLFDKKLNTNDDDYKENNKLYKLLDVAVRNHIKIEVHNFYKGLSITHEGFVIESNQDHTCLSSGFLQLKAMQYENRVILCSELFPQDLLYRNVKHIDFQEQRALLQEGSLSLHNATQREYIRIEPEEQQTITLFKEGRKFGDEVRVKDLSVRGVCLKRRYLLKGLSEGDVLDLDMVFTLNKRPFIIKAKGWVSIIKEMKSGWEYVLMFTKSDKHNKPLIDYVAKRQMALIREFKKMQYSADGIIHKPQY